MGLIVKIDWKFWMKKGVENLVFKVKYWDLIILHFHYSRYYWKLGWLTMFGNVYAWVDTQYILCTDRWYSSLTLKTRFNLETESLNELVVLLLNIPNPRLVISRRIWVINSSPLEFQDPKLVGTIDPETLILICIA